MSKLSMSLALWGTLSLVGCSSTPPKVTPCEADSVCSGGRCLKGQCFARSCDGQTCGAGQVCANSVCTDEQCVDTTCEAGSVCARGRCLPTACTTRICPQGQVCEEELCIDTACVGVVCPAGQVCSQGLCGVGVSCGGAVCGAGEVCDVDHCVEPACVGVTCDGGTCSAGQCVENACVNVSCDGGTTCQAGTCVDNSCVGVSCDGGICQGGQCVSICTVSCAAPCLPCVNGRSCAGALECESRLCSAGVCTACNGTSNTCPNGGVCGNGICRSGLNGPCTSTLDCRPGQGLSCDQGECRLTMGNVCASNAECISSLRCENLICQRPRCQLQLLETQTVPAVTGGHAAHAFGLSTVGELFVTEGQWTGSNNQFVRRFRVAPGQVQEQDPQAPQMLLSLDYNQATPRGHSDTFGSATNHAAATTGGTFSWYPGGGAFDGVKAVEIQFTLFNNDVSVEFYGAGRFAKCGDSFTFFVNRFPTPTAPQAMIRFQTPNPVGSGSTAQVLTASVARRDSWPFPQMADLNCFGTTIYALGGDGSNLILQRLGPTLAPLGTPISITPIIFTNPGDYHVAVVDDSLQFIVSASGWVWQIYNGVVTRLSNNGAISTVDFANASTPDTLVLFNSSSATPGTSTIRRYGRRMMDGSVPPLDLDCQWQ